MREFRIVRNEITKREYVNSIEDFKTYTLTHIKRVQVLAMDLKKRYPQYFNQVSLAQVENVIRYHDQAKLMTNLKALDGRNLTEAIYEDAYAKIPPANFRSNVVDVLNLHDQEIMEYAMNKYGVLSTEAREQIKTLEMIADFVDRGCHKPTQEEFGREMDLASLFLKDKLQASSGVVFMAKTLENNYSEITAGMEYSAIQTQEVEMELVA